jgi:hypothetical protein
MHESEYLYSSFSDVYVQRNSEQLKPETRNFKHRWSFSVVQICTKTVKN